MSNIGGVSGAASVNTSAPVQGGSLTIDALMLHCADQLNHIDSAIDDQMKRQNMAREQADVLGRTKSLMAGEIGRDDSQRKTEILTGLKKAYDTLPPGDPNRAQIETAYREYSQSACFSDGANGGGCPLSELTPARITEYANRPSANGGDNVVNADEMKKYSGYLDSVLTNISKGAELDMINLQSMVSKRQMAIQITTQLMSKMNESASTIAQQIGK